MARRKKEKKDQDVHIRMSNKQMEELELNSYYADMTKSEFARRAISTYFYVKKYAPELFEKCMEDIEYE
jgi:hypothetical protein